MREQNVGDVKEKWNFYFPLLLKLEMNRRLIDLGHQGQQSALLRALVRMFVEGEVDETKLVQHLKNEVYITPTGKVSKM